MKILITPSLLPCPFVAAHTHVRINPQAGLFGAYIIKDALFEDPLQLPSGAYDIPLVFHDKSFYSDGRIYVPYLGDNPLNHPHWVPEEFGEFVTVNGKVRRHFDTRFI